MPLYEEKIICPLAVRFTQEHIRPVFQNGMELEETLKEIKTKPGSGDYDVILDVPFPAIEVIRWHKRDHSGGESSGMHWLTFDNRRLYCLQRAAVALWPKRVGASVQALYAATNGYDRKDNSATAGRKVSIGHSMKLLTDRWDWRAAAAARDAPAGDAASAHEFVTRDDALSSVESLMDAPAPPSMLELFFQEGLALDSGNKAPSEEPSTADASSSSPRSDARDSDGKADGSSDSDDLAGGLCGHWQGAKGESYEVRQTADGFTCTPSGQRRVDLWHDAATGLVWWGRRGTMYAEAWEVCGQGGRVRWYGNDGSWTPKMTWTWLSGDGEEEWEENVAGAKVCASGDTAKRAQKSRRRKGAA